MPISVMLVDDHAVVRAGYRRLLELEGGFQVVAEAADGDAALHILRQRQGAVDVAVLDLSMPGRSGLDLLARMAAHWPAVQRLVFSMHAGPAVVKQALAAGAQGYVSKGSAPEVLVAALQRMVGSRHGRGAAGAPVLSADIEAALGQPTAQSPAEALSRREFEVLQGLAGGEPLEAIAQRLHLSAKTVANLQSLLKAKLGLATTVELLRYARAHGLVD